MIFLAPRLENLTQKFDLYRCMRRQPAKSSKLGKEKRKEVKLASWSYKRRRDQIQKGSSEMSSTRLLYQGIQKQLFIYVDSVDKHKI